jgi:hypothetical protein
MDQRSNATVPPARREKLGASNEDCRTFVRSPPLAPITQRASSMHRGAPWLLVRAHAQAYLPAKGGERYQQRAFLKAWM